MKKILAILIAAMLLLSTAAVAEEGLTYILGWGIGGDTQGPVEGWVADIWAKKGLQLEAIGNGNQNDKMQAMLASGDLPAVTRFNNWDQFNLALDAGYLLNLDDYIDQLPNTVKYAANALEFMRSNRSLGSGKLYGIPDNVGTSSSLAQNDPGCYAINVRWDIYRAAGYPQAKTLEDTIDVLKAMKAAYPKNADGLETYAMNMFAEWDNGTRFSFANAVLSVMGYWESGQNYFIEYNIMDEENPAQSMFEDGAFKRACHYLFLLNQAGLVDPDALTQQYTTSQSKINDTEQYFAAWWGGYPSTSKEDANAEETKGWKPLIFDEYVGSLLGDYPVGTAWPLTLNANLVDDPEMLAACLTFVDANADPEFLYELSNGPKGIFWDMNADGTTYALPAAFERADTGTYTLPSGEEYKFWNGRYTLMGTTINSVVDQGYNKEMQAYSNSSKLGKEWAEFYGVESEFPIDMMADQNRIAKAPTWIQFMPSMPDDLLIIKDAVGAVVQQKGWQMVYAADEAEFESLWQQMKADALALGAEEVQNWFFENYKIADELCAPYEYK